MQSSKRIKMKENIDEADSKKATLA